MTGDNWKITAGRLFVHTSGLTGNTERRKDTWNYEEEF